MTLSTQLHHVRYDTHALMCALTISICFIDLWICSFSSPLPICEKYFTEQYFPKMKRASTTYDFDRQFDSIDILIRSTIRLRLDIPFIFNSQKNFNTICFFIFAFLHLLRIKKFYMHLKSHSAISVRSSRFEKSRITFIRSQLQCSCFFHLRYY